ncbi:MAG: hypothetical protein LBS48_07000 [Treponema sp.]|jgi:alpha-N-arabinofuranosidase|nr:hypothetical protein [Treponema sp.]
MKKAFKDYFGSNGFWGLALHHYTLLNEGDITGNARGYATDFNESEWFLTMARSLAMDDLVRKHGAIMDKYDPGRQAALVIDEWGCFHNQEKGTDPALPFQQNSLMNALAAGIQLNVFNNYAERIRMSNLAQTINIVHSLILTEGSSMILTPTYHVFDLYKAHQDAIKLPLSVECENYTLSGNSVPALNISASMAEDYRIHILFCNLDPNKEMKTTIETPGFMAESVSGQIVSSGSMQDHNTVNKPELVKTEDYNDAVLSKRADRTIITLSIPAKSVTMLEIS